MKILCIIGSGGLGKEVADLAHRINKWDKIIFANDIRTKKVVNGIEVYTFEKVLDTFNNSDNDLEFIVAVGEPASREALYKKLTYNKLNYICIMDPGFILSEFSSIGKGTIIHTGAIVTCNTQIGTGSFISKNAAIGHDVIIGEYCVIAPNAIVSGNSKIGNNCYLGSGAIIRNETTIGDNSIIGMGAVVLEDVAPNSVMVGNPAKFIRNNDAKKVFR